MEIEDMMLTPKKSLVKKLAIGGVLAGSILFAGNMLSKRFNEIYFDEKDFDNAKWEQIYNKDGMIWDDYTASGIPQNGNNWTGYQIEVKKRNPRGFSGNIYIPIFDNKIQSD